MVSVNLVSNLRRQVSDMQNQLEAKDQELDWMKKKMKYTKINEIEVELETYKEQLQRLTTIIVQLRREKSAVHEI